MTTIDMTSFQRREELANQIRDMSADFARQGGHWHGSQQAEFDRLNSEFDTLAAEHKRAMQNVGRDGGSLSDGPVHADYFAHRGLGNDGGNLLDRAVSGWARNQLGMPISGEEANACDQFGISAQSGVFVVNFAPHLPKYGLGSISGPAGGHTVPQGFIPAFEQAMTDASGMLQVADIWRSPDAREVPWPTTDDTAVEAELLGENSEAATDDEPTFGATIFRSRKLSSKLVKVSHELLRDSSINLASELGKILGARIGRRLNRLCTTGLSAGGQPQGIVVGSTLGVTAASATSIAFDELIDLMHSVDVAYRVASENCGWMMSDTTAAHLRKKKDGEGNYIWQQSTQLGQPDRLLGWPTTINSHMASVASGAIPILFGAMKKYKIRLIAQLRLRRLVERYAEFDQEGFLSFQSFDAALLDAGSGPVRHLVMS